MGRPIFNRWLTSPHVSTGREPGVTWNGEFASWDALAARGRDQAEAVRPGSGYVIDPSAGLTAFAAFFAVATVPDTFLLWGTPSGLSNPLRPIAPALAEYPVPLTEPLTRPLWGTVTSGSSGTPKIPVGYGDLLELTALFYETALYRPMFPDTGEMPTLATCLPLAYAASFMMLVLPALLLRRDLVVFPPHDWRALHAIAQREPVACLTVPPLMAAASLSTPDPIDMSNAALIMASGYLAEERIRTTRERFRDIRLANCYGASETGVVTLDRDPGHNQHVGRPLPGKPVWLEDPDEKGIGAIATAGVDCRDFYLGSDRPLRRPDGAVAVTDYGHFDADGNLCLDGRLDGGEKLHGITIYPRTIERHILRLDGVADVRVVVEHRAGGLDSLVARVVGSATEGALREHCSALDPIERPARFECLPEGAAAYRANGKL